WPRGVGNGADIAVDGTQGDLLRAVVPRPIVPDRAAAVTAGRGLGTGDLRPTGSGRLGVADPVDGVPVVGEAGHAGQRTLTAAGMMPEAAVLGLPAGHPDGQLVADEDRLVPAGGAGRVGQGDAHPGRDVHVRLAPGRPERVAEVRPVRRPTQGAVPDAEPRPLEVVPRLDQPLVDLHVQAELGRTG